MEMSHAPNLRRPAVAFFRGARAPFIWDALAVALVGYVAYVLSRRLTLSNIQYDETWFLWSGWSTLHGAAPYRDFPTFKPPLLHLTNAAAIGLFGLEGLRFRYFFQLLAIGSQLALLVALLRRGVDRILSACAVLLLAALYFEPGFHDSSLNDAESIGLAYYCCGLACFLWSGKRRAGAQILAGAFFAACVLSKEPFALSVGPTWLAFMFEEGRTDRANLVGYVKRTFLGVGALVGIVFLHLLISGGLGSYADMIVQYAPFAKTYCVSLGRFTPSTFWANQLQNWNYLNPSFVNVGRLGAWLPFLIAAFATVTLQRALYVAFAAAAFIGALYSVTLGHCFWNHYYVMAIAGLTFLATVGAVGLATFLRRAPRAVRWWARLVIALGVFLVVSPRYSAEKVATYIPTKYGGLPAELIDFVRSNSTKDDYVLATGDPGVYVFAERRGASGGHVFLDELLVLFPGRDDDARLASLRAQLERTMPKVVYIDPRYDVRAQRFLSRGIFPFLKQRNYREVKPRYWLRP